MVELKPEFAIKNKKKEKGYKTKKTDKFISKLF